MKKLSILLIGLLAFSGFAFAQADAAPAIAATGSISFVFGADFNDETPNLPQFTSSKAATATLSLGTSDDKVSATIGLNLLAAPSVSTTITEPTITVDGEEVTLAEYFNETLLGKTPPLRRSDDVYQGWQSIETFDDFWNDNNDVDDSDLVTLLSSYNSGKFAFSYTYDAAGPYAARAAIVADTTNFSVVEMAYVIADFLWSSQTVGATTSVYNLVDEIDTDGNITLKTLVAPSSTPDTDEFNFNGADDQDLTDDVGDAWYLAVAQAITDVPTAFGLVDAQFGAGTSDYLLAKLTSDLDPATAGVQTLDDVTAGGIAGITGAGDLYTLLSGLNDTEFGLLSGAERQALKLAVDQDVALQNLGGSYFGDFSATSKVTYNPITSATFKIMGLGGVVDLTAGMNGGHVGVGAGINLDASGHQEDAVKSYPYLTIGLASGVVDGLSVSASVYSDGNDAEDQIDITDEWYTLLDESADNADPVEPKLGLDAAVGYSMDVMDGVTVGATAELGAYDLMGGDDLAFGFSVNPTFSGYGANVSVLYGQGLDMMHLYASADYTIMGITPMVGFRYAANNGDYVLKYVDDGEYMSGTDAVLGEGGMAIDGGVSADLSGFIPVAATVGAKVSYAMPTDFDAVLGWSANLGVTPIDMVTLTGAVAAVGIDEGDTAVNPLTWNVGVKATPLADVTLTGGIGQKWSSDNDIGYLVYNAGVSYVYGAATLMASYDRGYDSDDDATYGMYAFGMSVKF